MEYSFSAHPCNLWIFPLKRAKFVNLKKRWKLDNKYSHLLTPVQSLVTWQTFIQFHTNVSCNTWIISFIGLPQLFRCQCVSWKLTLQQILFHSRHMQMAFLLCEFWCVSQNLVAFWGPHYSGNIGTFSHVPSSGFWDFPNYITSQWIKRPFPSVTPRVRFQMRTFS